MLDSFSSLGVREAATALGFFFFRKRNQIMLFETTFSRLHVLFCFIFVFFYYLGRGGGGLPSKPRNRGFVIEECFLYSLFRGIMPDQEGPTISPIFLKKFFYDNEEFMFSTFSKKTIFRGFFISYTSEIKGTENSSVLVQIPRNSSILVPLCPCKYPVYAQ